MPENIPVTETLEMIQRGLSNEEITRSLEAKGYSLQQISDAINQASIKQGVTAPMPQPGPAMGAAPGPAGLNVPAPPTPEINQMPAEPVPQPRTESKPQYEMPAQNGPTYEEMQVLVEQIVEEKWKETLRDVGDIALFKSRITDDVEAIKQEVLRTQKRLEDMQAAVLGKVKDYNQSVLNMGSDMKALEQVFGRILEPLSTNVKELSKITEKLKK